MAQRNVANVHLGVCNVTYGGEDLGWTKGGCELTYEQTWYDFIPDTETAPTKDWLTGEAVTVKVPLAETNWENLNRILSTATPDGDATPSYFEVGGKESAMQGNEAAKELVLTPIDGSEVVTIYKARCKSPITLPYTKDAERVVEVTFTGLTDTTKSSGSKLMKFGL